MGTPKDDPMDLGPFLQEYVLRNPFENLPNGVPPGLSSSKQTVSKTAKSLHSPPAKKTCVRSKPAAAQMSPPIILRSPQLPSTGAVSPVLPSSVKVENSLSPLSTKEDEEKEDEVDMKDEPVDNNNDDGAYCEAENIPEKEIGDTPKAHIGSNITYAVALRELRLPPKHYKVKKWLTQNYKHVVSHQGWFGSDILLKHTKTLFTDMKSSVLSRIMKFTFPECRKVINKYGYFYSGLLPKPDNNDLKNLQLMQAAALVEEGTMTMSAAADQYSCTINQIGSILAWNKQKKLSQEEKSLVDAEVNGKKGRLGTSLVSSRLRSPPRAVPEPKPVKNKRKASSDPVYNPGGVKQKTEESENAGLASSRNRRKRGRPPKYRDSPVEYEETTDMANDDQEEKCEEGGKSDISSQAQGDSSSVVAGVVSVKDEPIDPEYEKAADITSKSSKQSSSKTKAGMSVGSNVSQFNAGSHNTAGQTINNVADLLSVRRELSETCSRLNEAEMHSAELETKLDDAHKEIAVLRDSLSTRELQITNLANSFFDLSNQFVRASQEFKRVMQSVHPNTGDKCDVAAL